MQFPYRRAACSQQVWLLTPRQVALSSSYSASHSSFGALLLPLGLPLNNDRHASIKPLMLCSAPCLHGSQTSGGKGAGTPGRGQTPVGQPPMATFVVGGDMGNEYGGSAAGSSVPGATPVLVQESVSGALPSSNWFGSSPRPGWPSGGGASRDCSISVRNPVQRGHRFQRKADSIPVIADSK
jgi:hypothetical protein